jgi:hypothetical protein
VKDVVEAAVQAAGRSGLRATVILLEGGKPVLGHAESSVGGSNGHVNGPDEGALNALKSQHDALARQRDSIASERDALNARVRELEASLAKAHADAAAQSAAAGVTNAQTSAPADGKQPSAMAAFEEAPIALLNLDEKVLKVCEKQGWDTVGKLRAAMLDGKLKEAKVADKAIVGVAERLLGRVERVDGQPKNGATAPASAAGGDPSLPVGHVDKPWKDRLDAARRKDTNRKQGQASVAALEAELAQKFPTAPNPPTEDYNALMKKLQSARSVLAVTNGQVIAMLFCLGLNHDLKEVVDLDGALKQAGLVHLMETQPAPAETAAAEA